MSEKKVTEALQILKTETSELIHRVPEVPTVHVNETTKSDWPLRFYRDFVSKNYPVVIRGGCKHFPAISKWNSKYFVEHIPNKEVTVAVTPNGYADGLATKATEKGKVYYFVLPEEVKMPMKEFIKKLDDVSKQYICYIQKQNSNLTTDFPELVKDVTENISWASDAFAKSPDAVNFWMGDARAITSLHKDPYENIYCVVEGFKDFLLIPPTDVPFIPHKVYPVGTYKDVMNKKCCIEDNPGEKVEWISVDPLKRTHYDKFPQFKNATQYKVRVKSGDCLYLPSLWYHHVKQSHKCIAVNYWYDMDFDVKYCYYKMLKRLCEKE